FQAAMIAVLWAVLFDWYDGIIARKMKGRTKVQGEFGAQLDSMIDIVSFGMLPAILLLSYGNYNIWFLPGAFVIIAASAIRLTYFNVYGLIDSKTYKGFPLDNNVLILALVFLFEGFFTSSAFSIIIYSLMILLSALNLSSIPTPKFGGKWVYALIAYVLVMTSVFGWILYNQV
ncbi:MAG: CDP-alcohol phosphatidyltransferase family protein, partial [Bacteroidales bacterium]|nr:CDP-alcohol phosphatidyltransferase family protein [Bacteroidales bacterium]